MVNRAAGTASARLTGNARPATRAPGALTAKDLIRYAAELGLDIEQFTRDLRNHAGEAKIAADVNSADLSGVSGTPAFFINSKRHHGAYDISTLSNAVRAARARTLITSHGQAPARVAISQIWTASTLIGIEPLPAPNGVHGSSSGWVSTDNRA